MSEPLSDDAVNAITGSTGKKISQDAIKALLSTSRSGKVKADPTETRDIDTWFKLNHIQRDEECDNPNCADPRKSGDVGRKHVTPVKGQYMCRFCFLGGWLKGDPIEDGHSEVS